jgi:hypothetical protein
MMRGARNAVLLAGIASTLACASAAPKPPPGPVDYAALATAEPRAPPTPPERIHALLLNGGGDPSGNYASHLAHIRELTALLTRAGVAHARISILSGDGDDPAPDLAAHAPDLEGSWLIAGTALGEKLLPQARFESSTVPSFKLQPATLPELQRWFKTTGASLRDGDTLLLYVTDHGLGNEQDVLDTRIVLWGHNATVSVRELRAMLRELRPGVRVVALMSQCYSGGFAWLSSIDGERAPNPNVCGYFSVRYDLKAYGCYSDLSGNNEIGHSFAFLRALARTGGFDDAHRATLVTDHTPDVPLRTSDVWLQELLNALATAARVDVDNLIDVLLAQAWENQGAWDPEIRLLDRIGEVYGFASPRSVGEMQETVRRLSRVRRQVRMHTDAWSSAVASATQSNLDNFIDATPSWAPRLNGARIDRAAAPERRALAEELLRDLSAFTAGRGGVINTVKLLSGREEVGEALSFRTQVRISALVRVGAILTSIAGRVYLGAHGDKGLLDAYRAMRDCEELTLAGLGAPAGTKPLDEPPVEPLPQLADELRALAQMVPAWTGLETRPPSAQRAARQKLPPGASVVTSIDERSPAEAAGLAVDDVILGPPGAPFVYRRDLLPWLMLLKVGEPRSLLVRRGRETVTVTLTPRAFPIEWPSIGAPRRMGAATPTAPARTRSSAGSAGRLELPR